MLIKLNSRSEEHDPTAYFKECITALTNYLAYEVADRFGGAENSEHCECAR
jgi:hypothetical protein